MLCSCNHYYELYERASPRAGELPTADVGMGQGHATTAPTAPTAQHCSLHRARDQLSRLSSSHRGQPIRSQDAWKLTNQRLDPRELSNVKV